MISGPASKCCLGKDGALVDSRRWRIREHQRGDSQNARTGGRVYKRRKLEKLAFYWLQRAVQNHYRSGATGREMLGGVSACQWHSTGKSIRIPHHDHR